MDIIAILDKEISALDRSIVATPETREALDAFSKSNYGAMDAVLTQMAVQFGYIYAMKHIKQTIQASDEEE